MQNLNEEPLKIKLGLKDFREMFRVQRNYRKHPEVMEPFIAYFREKGVSETNLSAVRNVVIASSRVASDHAATYRIDSYLMTGMGAIDLVMMAVLFTIGARDMPLSIAAYSLAISLVLTGLSLVISFIKRDLQINVYGKVHGAITFFGLASGLATVTATFWHVSTSIGIVFLVLAVLAFFTSVGYIALARFFVNFLQLAEVASATATSDECVPVETQVSASHDVSDDTLR